MARVPISATRRLELVQAAYDAVKKSGFRGYALEEVARQAGTAKGTIHHYFLNKEELIDEVVRYVNRDLSQAILDMIKAAKSPSERLWSIIWVNLSEEYFSPIIARSYTVGTAIAIRYPHLLRIYDAIQVRTISNLAFALRQLARPEDVRPIASTIWTMIEGAWLLQATQEEKIATYTLRILADYLQNTVPGFDSSIVQALDRLPEGPAPSHNRT
jgi:TetR/AcrR family transcriptional regulator, transcriptional repressor of bet genes